MNELKQYLRNNPELGIGGGAYAWCVDHLMAFLPGMFHFVVNLGALAGALAAVVTAWLKVADWWRAIGEPWLFRIRKRLRRP